MKIKYTMQHEETGYIAERDFDFDDAVDGTIAGWLANDMRRWFVVNREFVIKI